ncbi:MAG TPA: VWA domain-containing protein [Blastocatellia bacterium]
MSRIRLILAILVLLPVAVVSLGQSGKDNEGRGPVSLNVIIHAPKDKLISKDIFDLYDSGVAQEIETLTAVPTGSVMVLLVDNTVSQRVEPSVLQKAALSMIDELYQDDQMLVVGYNENAEIIQDMTGDLGKLQMSTSKFVHTGFPKLFDALIAVSDALEHQTQAGVEKRVIILVSDGYDSGSVTKFSQALYALQDNNIILYAIQLPDRTHGALLRDKPKPTAVLERLTVGTGGVIYPIADIATAAKSIADELRKNWYKLIYTPAGLSTITDRRLLLLSREADVKGRTKGSQPSRFRPPD